MFGKDHHIYRIAMLARKEIDIFRQSEYEGYSNEQLACLCGISSWFIMEVCQRLGYKIEAASGVAFRRDYDPDLRNHCWNLYRGRIIVDITATQFNRTVKPVHLTTKADPSYKFKGTFTSDNYEDFFSRWPSKQTPNTYLDILEGYMENCIAAFRGN